MVGGRVLTPGPRRDERCSRTRMVHVSQVRQNAGSPTGGAGRWYSAGWPHASRILAVPFGTRYAVSVRRGSDVERIMMCASLPET
jgi:hypothetical protein